MQRNYERCSIKRIQHASQTRTHQHANTRMRFAYSAALQPSFIFFLHLSVFASLSSYLFGFIDPRTKTQPPLTTHRSPLTTSLTSSPLTTTTQSPVTNHITISLSLSLSFISLFSPIITHISSLTLKHAKKIKTREFARVVKSLPHTKS
jgi:hypothetical protein